MFQNQIIAHLFQKFDLTSELKNLGSLHQSQGKFVSFDVDAFLFSNAF